MKIMMRILSKEPFSQCTRGGPKCKGTLYGKYLYEDGSQDEGEDVIKVTAKYGDSYFYWFEDLV